MIEQVFAATDREALLDPGSELASAVFAVVPVLTWSERWELARPMLEGIIAAARSAGAATGLPFWLAALSELELRGGRIAKAYAAASESVALARDTGQVVELPYSLVTLARVLAVLGYDDDCRSLVSTALTSARRTGAGSISVYSASVLGLLELGRRSPGARARASGKCARLRVEHGLGLLGGLSNGRLPARGAASGRRAGAAPGRDGRPGQRARRTCAGARIAARGRAMLAGRRRLRAPLRAGAGAARQRQRVRARPYAPGPGTAPTAVAAPRRRPGCAARGAGDLEIPPAGACSRGPCRPAPSCAPSAVPPPPRRVRQSSRSLTPQELQVAMTVAGGATKEAAASRLSTRSSASKSTSPYWSLGSGRRGAGGRVEGLL